MQGSLYLYLEFTDTCVGKEIQYKDRNFHSASVDTNYFRAFSLILVLWQVCFHLDTSIYTC